MAHCWHISIVKTHVHQHRDPNDHKDSTTREEKPNHSYANEATSGQCQVPNESYDPPVTHDELGLKKKPG